MAYKIQKTEEEWKAQLGLEKYKILRQKGTEFPHTGQYNLIMETTMLFEISISILKKEIMVVQLVAKFYLKAMPNSMLTVVGPPLINPSQEKLNTSKMPHTE